MDKLDAPRRKSVYIAGALTDMTEAERTKLRAFYESLADVCREFDLEPYVPHIYGDPKLVAHLTPQDIDRIDRLAVTQSYLVIVYVGVASTGVGIEIELAHHANKPVVILFEKAKLEARRVSRLVRGNPAVKAEIAFDDFRKALVGVRQFLTGFHENIMTEELPPPLNPTFQTKKAARSGRKAVK